MFGLKIGELVLLMSKKNSYLTDVRKDKLHTSDGIIDLSQLLRKKFGDDVKTHLNKKFVVVKPNIIDILEKRMKRMPQIIMPKDIALILAYTGVGQGCNVVDVGTGSGFLAIMLANYVKPGKTVTYEINKKILKVAKKNIEDSGLSKFLKIKNKDAAKGISEKNVDLITIDVQKPEKVVKYAYNSLGVGGYLVVYCPIIEEVMKVIDKIKKFNFSSVRMVENIVREWQTERTIRPKTMGLMHTGFILFARKIS